MASAIVLLGIGTPAALTTGEIRRWLREFLSDKRVVGLPRWLWLPILYAFILPFRPAKVGKKYAKVWLEQGSPLLVYSLRQAAALQQQFPDKKVVYAERYGKLSIDTVLNSLRAQGVDSFTFLPLFPQYSSATTAAVYDQVCRWLMKQALQPEVYLINSYQQHPAYIAALAAKVSAQRQSNPEASRKLLISFHSVPCQQIARGDVYFQHCQQTAYLLAEKLQLSEDQWELCFQSSFSRGQWLGPDTLGRIEQLAQEGKYSLEVICPGFLADCLETLWDMGIEAREVFAKYSTKTNLTFAYIPCLNDDRLAIEAFAAVINDKANNILPYKAENFLAASKIKLCCGLCAKQCCVQAKYDGETCS